MRFVFAGTTEFGIPTLEKLMQDGHELLFVITQPDKPVGRKRLMFPTPVKSWAIKNNIRVLEPVKIIDSRSIIIDSNPDLLLVAAYGQIIPKEILDLPKFGSVNIHGSILPEYRGASPIQTAILEGKTQTGITLIKMDEKMDHGPILATKEVNINKDETFRELYKKLSSVTSDLSAEVLPKYIQGEITPKEQDHTQATFTKLLRKENARIDWTKSSVQIYNLIRALNPEPGTYTTLEGKLVNILQAKPINYVGIDLPGKLIKTPEGLLVKTQDSALFIEVLQSEGKKGLNSKDFVNGLKNIERLHFV